MYTWIFTCKILLAAQLKYLKTQYLPSWLAREFLLNVTRCQSLESQCRVVCRLFPFIEKQFKTFKIFLI